MRQILFLALFAAAVVLLGDALAAWRVAAHAPTAGAWLHVVFVWGGVVAVVLALGLMLYAADRAAGKVRRRIGLYEWVLSRQGVRDA